MMTSQTDTSNSNTAPATGAGRGALFVSYLEKVRPIINDRIERNLPRGNDDKLTVTDLERYLYAPLARFIRAGGKRIRPALVLLGCEAVGGDTERALGPAVAVENFQSAALIHDDIADEGEMRRGAPCVHRTEGVGSAINIGDLALVEVFDQVLNDGALDDETRMRVLRELVVMERRTLEGQALDLGWSRDGRWDVAVRNYLCMAAHKTAVYSAAAPLTIGAIVGGGDIAQVEGLGSFGLETGLAFQLQDDLLNLVGDPVAQGKDFRSDITEGKRTMIVCWALEHLDQPERDELVGILSSHTTDENTLARAVELMEQVGAIREVRDFARTRATTAKRQLDEMNLAPGMREVLESMADFFVERKG
jgi:geranylgeranyl diphosphate synthase type I